MGEGKARPVGLPVPQSPTPRHEALLGFVARAVKDMAAWTRGCSVPLVLRVVVVPVTPAICRQPPFAGTKRIDHFASVRHGLRERQMDGRMDSQIDA